MTKMLWVLGFFLGVASCTTSVPFEHLTVTPTHLYLHAVRVSGSRQNRISGYRCTTRPLFFRQDPTNLEQRGILEALERSTRGRGVAAERVRGHLTIEERGLWTRQCVTFSAVPIVPGGDDTGWRAPETRLGFWVRVQQALVANGARIWIDGSPGPETRKAIASFQKKHGLTENSRLTQATSSLLFGEESTTKLKMRFADRAGSR